MIPGSMAQIPLENFLQFADLGVTEDNEITRQPYFVVTRKAEEGDIHSCRANRG